MTTYHSKLGGAGIPEACGIPLLEVQKKDNFDKENPDIVDEAIDLFRIMIMFKNFKIKTPADRPLVYLTCFIQKCVEEIGRQ